MFGDGRVPRQFARIICGISEARRKVGIVDLRGRVVDRIAGDPVRGEMVGQFVRLGWRQAVYEHPALREQLRDGKGESAAAGAENQLFRPRGSTVAYPPKWVHSTTCSRCSNESLERHVGR